MENINFEWVSAIAAFVAAGFGVWGIMTITPLTIDMTEIRPSFQAKAAAGFAVVAALAGAIHLITHH